MIFKYQPLDPERKEIRVLYFEPNSHLRSELEVLRFRSKHISLNAYPLIIYNAISYCWGENPRTKTIVIDDSEVSVPVSTETALRSTHRKKAGLDIPVWIDAICINQTELTEKSQQVAIMGDIYSKAEKVLVWLGSDDDDTTPSAIKSIDTVLDWRHAHAVALEEAKVEGNEMALANLSRFTSPSLPGDVNWKAIEALFGSTWFQRLWTVQEVVLASEAICFRGGYSLPYAKVAAVADVMYKSDLIKGERKFRSADSVSGTVFVSTLKEKGWRQLATMLLAAQHNFATSNQSDRIYALLGLLGGGEASRRIMARIRLDYSLPVKDVYISATLASIESGETGLLHFAQYAAPLDRYTDGFWGLQDTLDCPSWVPRYDIPRNIDRGTPALLHQSSASGGIELTFDINANDARVLRVKGCVVDTVTCRHALQPVREGDMRNVGIHALKFAEYFSSIWATRLKGNHSWTASDLEQLAVTHVLGRYEEDTPAPPVLQIMADFKDFFKLCRMINPDNAVSLLEHSLPDYTVEKPRGQHYYGDLFKRAPNRVLFETSHGRQGMGSRLLDVGDKICIIFGCSVPLVLRQEGSFWRHRGDAYLYGIMDVSSTYHASR
jgi:hypothetical protein